ncbi:hypothetical protein BOC57_21350 [Burkholderia pseudomallei]|nr:hypothetical protein BOC57_21350 [Burkholderia pseudomallei]NRD84353.1 hypothetical protein [Burkholderia pseudomallei]
MVFGHVDAEAAGRNRQRIILALRRPAGSASPRSGLADRMRKKRVRGRDIGRMKTSNSLQ